MIGGNITAILQKRRTGESNSIGERMNSWLNVSVLTGFLDYYAGDSRYTYNAKLQESTHIFICDYDSAVARNPDDKRMVINNMTYDVLLIDDPMELHQHMEIYLKYVG